ncbi:MAG: ABC transporter ATP-binding protein [Gemmatimonadota bacterium]|jgi:ABC-2 type transport system ATP-binding protein|nr:ABC transporter ATP-binding protein [Gemmatimonadota bacterium]
MTDRGDPLNVEHTSDVEHINSARAGSGAPVLEVRDLSKAYRRRPILRGVSLTVQPGEAVAVIGGNGAGKSTFLGCLTGERLPDSGTVRIAGADPFADLTAVAAALGSVPEHPFLYGELTVAETLRFITEARRLDRAASLEESGRLLGIFGLEGAEGLPCRELSQGMGRKVAVVAALLHNPRLLVLDEVFNGLDRASSASLIRELDHRRSRGCAVLLSSHDFTMLAEWCGRGLLLTRDSWKELEGDAWQAWARSPSLAG